MDKQRKESNHQNSSKSSKSTATCFDNTSVDATFEQKLYGESLKREIEESKNLLNSHKLYSF
ncbi:hypothetical protein AVO42_02675 [Thiomicrospira sp. XS5]|uniref:hypothetical protein n=1 Tax=Thiomicrospira sp. XS5 TaxID=1775636 RepID=UPI0007473CCD|nr:hypothetical protein [Thiomicrospira sp. XS5]KUJ74332.1 hypothetical protein AVO42_02675 [Thiomicrospira sp. XS5]